MKKGYHSKKGDCFSNPHIKSTKRSLIDIALWQLGYYNDKNPINQYPKEFSYPNPKCKLKENNPRVTWINHSTCLISIGNLSLLTDPIWSKRCSPFPFLGPKRRHTAPLPIENLPRIDMVMLSHDHYDHFDKTTLLKLKKLHPNILWIVPLGLKKRLHKLAIYHSIEMNWWEKRCISVQGEEVIIRSVPTQHFSGRGIFDTNHTLWSGFVVDFIRKKKRLYFVGDTGYNEKDFKKIGITFKAMDLSLIPIGTYLPQAFMDPVHINPYKAVTIHQEVGSFLSIGMHWNTFRLSSEAIDRPPYDLYCALQQKNIDPKSFRVLEPGQTINW